MVKIVDMLFDQNTNKLKISIASVLAVLTVEFFFPTQAHVAAAQVLESPDAAPAIAYKNSLPLANEVPLTLDRSFTIAVTAYNSEPGQTDSTPCITANGFNLCKHGVENVIATNMLPFGTKVKFPEIDPDRVYTVQDRMNARYYKRADIWMKEKSDAKKFGIKHLTMEVYK